MTTQDGPASRDFLEPALATQPATAADAQVASLAQARFDELMRRFPVYATYLGIDEYDGELADGSGDAVRADIDVARRFMSALEAIDEGDLSPYYATERELGLFVTRRQIFDDEVHRVWQRRVNATDEIGDGIFLVFARGRRPLPELMASIASRLEAAPRHIEEQKTRLNGSRPVRLWNEMELQAVQALPTLFDDIAVAAREGLGDDHAETRRLDRASRAAGAALEAYASWVREQLGRATDEFALGAEDYDRLVGLRAFDELDTDQILAIGEEQLALHHEARRKTARLIDPEASELDVVNRVKADHPETFADALHAYREAMAEARQFVIDNDIASIPEGESLDVIETPRYLRNQTPFAAYFSPPKFGAGNSPKGLYVVTPSLDEDPAAMREHNYASIYNTSIHEAYPGHHLQLAAALTHPSLIRLLVDAPEYVEGWAMYCEQMMREEGFDTMPEHMLMLHTDAIWRACRIVLDIKLHRGQIGVAEATDFLVEHTNFERPNAQAEVNRYTYTPTYQMSYLLGKVMLLRLRDDERRRLGERFSLRGFHDALLREGSLPVSFQRRLLARAIA